MTNDKYTTLEEILAPISPEEFLAVYRDKKPLHISGKEKKFSTLMSWERLNSLLNITAFWTPASLQLVLEGELMSPSQYCRPAANTEGRQVLRPDATLITNLLQQGASLVANDIDTLTPELAETANALETALGGKTQTNLYCSWREQRAFKSHFDTHEVFAIHTVGEKVWRIYEGRLDNPIAHPGYKNYGHEFHEKRKGKVVAEIAMQPGDLLYIPRGQYHDALASSDGTIHVSFGVTNVIGLDFLSLLYDQAINDAMFRSNAPSPTKDTDIAEYLAGLGDRLAEIARQPKLCKDFTNFQRDFRYQRGGFSLPIKPAATRYRKSASDLRVEKRSNEWVLVNNKGNAPIPLGLEQHVSWIVDRNHFSAEEFGAAFPDTAGSEIEKLLNNLSAMKVIRKI